MRYRIADYDPRLVTGIYPNGLKTVDKMSKIPIMLVCPGEIGRYLQSLYSPVAQLVEQLTVNQRAVGSSPTGGALLDRGANP